MTLGSGTAGEAGVPFGARLSQLADEDPGAVGVVFVAESGDERLVTVGELDDRSTRLAHVLADRGVTVGDSVAVSLKNSPEHLVADFAAWKVGATVIPMRWDLPEWERDRLLAVIEPAAVVDSGSGDLWRSAEAAPAERLPEVTAPRGSGVCSSGSTGAPKVIVQKAPGLYFASAPNTTTVVEAYGPLPRPQVVLVPAPLYHTNGFTALRNLMGGDTVVLLERFNAVRIVDLIERHRITGFVAATPMLQRLAHVPGIEGRDLSSLGWVQQGAAPLPEWLGRYWCDLVGPRCFFLSYGSSEGAGLVTCRGDEWLEHPGTLGRGFGPTEVKILDAQGAEVAPGEIGGIYTKMPDGPAATYVGDVPPMTSTLDGFITVGDLGWMDEDGWVFLADRRVDMIVTGAANVFPAEVEAALSEHPGIADVVVIGLRDPEWGRRVHAIVVPGDGPGSLTEDEVVDFARSRLAPYKIPKTVELVDALPRSDAMKLNRSELVAERDGPEPEPPAR
ncbi:MAG TPA: AMP-binding protein [Acidimicrobiales bacterium]|nr:AMP-binding protein [Acidimicrobiales bacterium]